MKLKINGAFHQVEEDMTLSRLLQQLKLKPQKIAIELNLEIVPKSLYEQTQLKEADQLEIVQFVGGG
ncbi:MAG: sulfur carrier protein ThiS [bacterium]